MRSTWPCDATKWRAVIPSCGEEAERRRQWRSRQFKALRVGATKRGMAAGLCADEGMGMGEGFFGVLGRD
jgi:hypothetical protein